ncbi:hypothetical protein [Xenorhabdus indica]|uniref:hypothetical protein n=1 Tax=Xenorhabdus indica TaxID=333964 RepID=UPI0021D5093E|nr:hypothetical protein [Xenorhabdus indica]
MSARPHLISDVAFGPITQSEISYAQQLVGSAPENTLTLFDRGLSLGGVISGLARYRQKYPLAHPDKKPNAL